MPIQYPVARRTIVLCDYGMGGFREPEMVKRRPAIVFSPRLPHRDGLCGVVPLSGSEPSRPVPYVVRVKLAQPLPAPFAESVFWAKCDMIATVAVQRLDLFRLPRENGRRKYLHPKVDVEAFEAVARGVLHGLGLGHLTLTAPRSSW